MTQDIATVSFLEKLRSETAQAHTSLERVPVSGAILKTSVTNEQYAAYLRLMYDVVASLETDIHPKIAMVVTDLDQRQKAKDIEADLKQIGCEIPVRSKAVFEATGNVGFALGIAYVVEGSTLGGRVILKNIQAVLGHDENSGASYFAGYGNKTGSMWKSFLSQMTQYVSETSCEDDVIAGANYAFTTIHEHLSAR
ncbi:biliverdin-producing heme oxygenase [Flavobacterium selenitireducens]|uniref:biliverdin-producing heme oxygenase n=1 Tax=Flavobacterium selenitireducens TaxID=2722704 RepID=UPI00168A73F5|nr:biliverdin-producing heme oxygenase [Flavobacterium selenitireducens]MBD3583800.1 biliverdin-producing heme oxygenase [Flavobacterium selenitireducens]